MAERSIITDKVVAAKTGSTMEEWFRHFDSLGAAKLDSKGIYALINSVEGLEPLGEWNRGLLSTSYQWSRGLRERGEKEDGFEVTVSKTIGVPIGAAYAAVANETARKKWLPENINITKMTENKSVRAVSADGATRLSIDLYSKGNAKSQIVVQHLKLATADDAAKMKEFWSSSLSQLKEILEN